MTEQSLAPLVFERNGSALADSRGIATSFGKDHRNVLRAVRTLLKSEQPEIKGLFTLAEYLDGNGDVQPYYEMSRDGFTLLAMGFTGERALSFKLRYIDAFNQMETALRGPSVPAKPDEMLRRMDGMLKMLSHKGTVTEKTVVGLERDVASLAAIVRDLVKCADGRFAVIDAVPALQIATDAKVPKAGRRPIVQEISRKLTRFCADNGYVVRRDARGTKLYSVNAVNEWRLSGGDSLIRKLVAANHVIGPLFAVVPGGKGQPTA